MLGSRLLQAFSARLQEFRWSAAFWAHEPVTSHQSRLWLARVRVEKLKKKHPTSLEKLIQCHAVDQLARGSMKNAAKCVTQCELQDT